MISDRVLADISAETYAAGHQPTYQTQDVHLTVGKQGGILYWAFRGSACLRDWLDDVSAFPRRALVEHADLGLCDPQFLENALQVLEPLIRDIGGNPQIGTGHSKGAAEAEAIAALLALRGLPPLKLTVFAPARIGALQGLLRSIPGSSYRWRDDPVPLLPSFLPHPRPLTQLGAPSFELDVFADHHMANYQAQTPADA
jgi:hypothetical protein